MIDWSAIGTVLAGGSAMMAGSAYVYGLKGRLDSHDILFEEREKAQEAFEDRSKERHEETKAQLARIEALIKFRR